MPSNNSSSGNVTTDTQDNPNNPGTTVLVLIIGSNFLVCSVILVNNILMLVTIAKTRQLWTLTNAYVASLSAADLLVGIELTVRHFWLIPETSWIFDHNKFACLPVISLLYVSGLESQACLVLVSADRYMYIVHPFWYERNITGRVTGILIASSWVLSIILGFLPMHFNNFSPEQGCNPMSMISKYYLLGCLAVYFFVASTIIVVMYGRVFCVGNQQRKRIEATTAPASNRGKKDKSRWQVIKFLILVCGLFFLCWLPLAVTVFFYFTIGVPYGAISVTVSISGLNSGLNFYVFLSMNKTFKTALGRLICCCRRGNRSRSAVSPWTVGGTRTQVTEFNGAEVGENSVITAY